MTAEELRGIRTRIRFTQREMADALGIQRERYANWEGGRAQVPPRYVEAIQAISSRYNLDSDDYIRVRATPSQLRVTLALLYDTQDPELKRAAYEEMKRILGLD